jgi:ribosomal protein S18 acetylase RimI-like enzyme
MRITGYKHREDFSRVMEINDACYSGVYRPPRDLMSDMVSVSDVFIAREDCEGDWSGAMPDTMLGFAITRNPDQPYIWNIAVDPAYQGRGVAGNLLREIIKRYTLEKCTQITLHVNVNNPAQKLYFDYGFRVISIEEDYFAPNDGLMMERKLP